MTPRKVTAQAQGVRSIALGQRADQPGPLVFVPGLGNVTVGFAEVGPNGDDVDFILTITGFSFTVDVPSLILFQPRQSINEDVGFPDQFAVQVLSAGRDNIVCRIRRQDDDAGPTGWGQNLRLDIFVVD